MPLAKELAAIAPLATLLDSPLVVADVGCRWGFAETWSTFGGAITILGFDPDAAECARLERDHPGGQDVRFVPRALGATAGPATLHLTAEPACSSLYPPDTDLAADRPLLRCIEPAGTARVELTTLDDYLAESGMTGLDFLKLDTQGSELDVLRGATSALGTVRALEVEVEFNPIYRGQPLFGDVDRFLRDRGFVLWRLGNLVHYELAGARSDFPIPERHHFDSRPADWQAGGGQLSWGHAYFVRREAATAGPAPDCQTCLRDACLAAALGFRDLAGRALVRALDGCPAGLREAIRAALTD